jgi:hypothetical protein
MNRKSVTLLVCFALALSAIALAASSTASLKAGKAELKSAGVLAFGPDGVLFVGDSLGASIWALDTGDRVANKAAKPVDIKGINEKIAALLGTAPDQILIQDVAVNPISKRVYVAVSRGKGPDATPVLLRTDASGKIEEFALDSVKHSRVDLPNAPAADAKDRRGQPVRQEAISDLAYVDGRVFIAGLSNEEFASNLRSVPFPFAEANRGTSVEIYHGQHGRFETNSPVRTFVPYKVKNEDHILAAYTCTPLVKFPVSSLKPGAKVTGTTIAELGNRNRPLDMIVYKKDGADYILMNNSSRGVMKMSTNGIEAIQPIVSQTEKAGLPFETLAELKNVQQLDRYDSGNAVILVGSESGSIDLKSIALP